MALGCLRPFVLPLPRVVNCPRHSSWAVGLGLRHPKALPVEAGQASCRVEFCCRAGMKQNNTFCTCACYPLPVECIFMRKLSFRIEGFLRARIQHQDLLSLVSRQWCRGAGENSPVLGFGRPHTPRTDRKHHLLEETSKCPCSWYLACPPSC